MAMQGGSAAAPLGRDPIGQHGDNRVKFAARQVAIGVSAADEIEQIVLAPIAGSGLGHNLLSENVERRAWNLETIELARANGANQSGTFDQLVARGGEEAPLGQGSNPVAGAPDA